MAPDVPGRSYRGSLGAIRDVAPPRVHRAGTKSMPIRTPKCAHKTARHRDEGSFVEANMCQIAQFRV